MLKTTLAAAAALLVRRPGVAAALLAPYLQHYRRVYSGDAMGMARALPTHLAIDMCEIGVAAAGTVTLARAGQGESLQGAARARLTPKR